MARLKVRRCRSCRIPFAPFGQVVHGGRGLCRYDYDRHHRAGTLDRFARVTWPAEDLVADAEILRARTGETWRQVALRLGVSYVALDKARERVRARARAAGRAA